MNLDRRRFVSATATLVTVGLAGCGGDGDSTDSPTATDTATDTETDTATQGGNGVTHTVDMTDQLVFDPDSLTIAPGDTVVWENVGTIGHSVTAYEEDLPDGADYWASGGFDSEAAARDAYSGTGSLEETGNVAGGESWSHTFETEGVHQYFCIPHEAAGMVGEIEVSTGGATATGTATATTDTTTATTTDTAAPTATPNAIDQYMLNEGTPANNYDGTVVDMTGNGTITVEVGAGSMGLAYGPAAVRIDTGTTIQFEWTGNGGGHNVVATDDAAAPLDSGAAEGGTGVKYEYTFDSTGLTPYYCTPHQSAGMKGVIEVV